VLLSLFVVAACSDSPTVPTVSAEGSRASEHVTYYPGTGECDPWMNLNWCEGRDPGECITSDPSTGEPEEYVGIQGCGTGGGDPGGGGTPTDPPPADTACNTSDNAVLNDPSVQAGFESLWNQSGMNLQQSQRLESAGWIIQNADGSRQLVAFSYTQRNACAVNGNLFPPPGAVGFVHTHPFTTGERMTACGPITYEAPNGQTFVVVGRDGQPLYHAYNNQPSPRDRDLLQNVINRVRKSRGEQPLEGYVIDNEGITRYSGLNGDKDKTYGRCGY
jgi:hypothetical protein